MARASTKENKNIYQTTREGLKLTREAASELLETMTPERIEKIENRRVMSHPDEVLLMSGLSTSNISNPRLPTRTSAIRHRLPRIAPWTRLIAPSCGLTL